MTEKKIVLVQIDDIKLQQTLEELQQLPRKGRPLREVIAFLCEEIQQTLAKGYSYPEVVEFLRARGIAIAEHTLRQYLSEASKTKSQKKLPAKKSQTSETQNRSTLHSPDNPHRPTTQSSDPQPKRHKVGRFVEMPDEL
jgi:hypothetical protein